MSTTNGQTARVLVTGASGNNGHRLVRELNDDRGPEDVTVVAAVRNELKAEEFAALAASTTFHAPRRLAWFGRAPTLPYQTLDTAWAELPAQRANRKGQQ
jgi:nucleoside-diphosphate-sugar epimerase